MEREKNVSEILVEVNKLIDYCNDNHCDLLIRDVYRQLNIFDWWALTLNVTRLRDMKRFLNTALKLGYTGYCCFKVGLTGCGNGMWAYKRDSYTGYSPNGESLYKSFVPSEDYWQVKFDTRFLPNDTSIKTIKQLKEFIEKGGK